MTFIYQRNWLIYSLTLALSCNSHLFPQGFFYRVIATYCKLIFMLCGAVIMLLQTDCQNRHLPCGSKTIITLICRVPPLRLVRRTLATVLRFPCRVIVQRLHYLEQRLVIIFRDCFSSWWPWWAVLGDVHSLCSLSSALLHIILTLSFQWEWDQRFNHQWETIRELSGLLRLLPNGDVPLAPSSTLTCSMSHQWRVIFFSCSITFLDLSFPAAGATHSLHLVQLITWSIWVHGA